MRSLVAAYPVPRSGDAPARIMFAALDIRRLAEATALNEVPRGTTYLLLDHAGTIIARAPAGPHRRQGAASARWARARPR